MLPMIFEGVPKVSTIFFQLFLHELAFLSRLISLGGGGGDMMMIERGGMVT